MLGYLVHGGAHGEHDTGAPRAAATTGTAKLRRGKGHPRGLPSCPLRRQAAPAPTTARPEPPHRRGTRLAPCGGGRVSRAPQLHLRPRRRGGARPVPSPGRRGWKRGVSGGGEGAGAGGRGSVGVIGHVEGLPGGPRVVAAALVLAQCRQPVHLRGKGKRQRPLPGVQPSGSARPQRGHSPWGAPAHKDTVFSVLCAPTTALGTSLPRGQSPRCHPSHWAQPLVSPVMPQDVASVLRPLHGDQGPWHPCSCGAQPLVSPVTLWDVALSIP